MAYVYLIHFDHPYQHARHYIGYSDDVDLRLERHRNGRGSPLLRSVAAAGIGFSLVRLWPNVSRDFERRLKKRKKARLLCPVCNPISWEMNAPLDPKGNTHEEET